MAYGYVISKEDLSVVDIFTATDYEISLDKEYHGKSKVSLSRKPEISEGDFLFMKDPSGKIFYIGVTDTVTNDSGSNLHEINLIEKETIFDRKIILSGEAVISSTGIEDFIVNTIKREFISSNDPLLNLDYIEVEALTHTKVYASVDTETGGIYNFLTYLGNAREYYGIFVDFTFSATRLKITVSKKTQNVFKIDASVSDVTNYVEDYSVDALAKLTAIWKVPDQTENGVVTKVGATTILYYFLLNNRTISTNVSDPNRAKGKVDTIYVECESRDEADQTARDAFTGNSYQHSVTADIRRANGIYPEEEFYIGHTCEIKTKAFGVRDSIVSSISYKKDSAYISVKFGNMAVTLIEKLRKERKK